MRLRLQSPIVALFLAYGIVASTSRTSAAELDGRWRQGSWTDSNSGHEGPLRARFHLRSDGNYRVVFTGRFARVVPFRFATTLNVVGHEDGKTIMAGESRVLGFGRFNYHAVADEHTFQSEYSSWRWRGEFNLQR